MINRGTHEGDIQELNDVIYINENRELFNEYFNSINATENTFVVRVTTKQLSSLVNRKVMTRADAYAINVKSDILLNYIRENHYIDEDILKNDFTPNDYTFIPNSGISIKLSDSEKYQILKLTPHSFYNLFKNYELGAGASLFCMREDELPKNLALLTGWNTSIDNMIAFFRNCNLSQDFIYNKEKCSLIKDLSNKLIAQAINNSIPLQKKIFNGIDLYEEPYTAYYFCQNQQIEKLTYIDFTVTTGSGRSHGDYTIVLKPKGKH